MWSGPGKITKAMGIVIYEEELLETRNCEIVFEAGLIRNEIATANGNTVFEKGCKDKKNGMRRQDKAPLLAEVGREGQILGEEGSVH